MGRHQQRAALPPPSFASARLVTSVVPLPPLTATLSVERRPSRAGPQPLPRARCPAAICRSSRSNSDLGGGHVLREAAVYEARLSGTEAVPVRARQRARSAGSSRVR